MNMYMGNGILYSNSEMLNETFYIYKAENDSSIQCGNIDSYNGKKTGVLKNDQRMVAVLEKLKSRYHVNIECVYYTDMPECANLLSALRVSHLLAIVNEILEISRIESGQTKLDEAVCNLEDIIKKQILSSGIRRRKHLQTLYLLKIKNPATLKRG